MPKMTTWKNHPNRLKKGMKKYNHALRHFKQKISKPPLPPIT
jgi:hypothetical protein